MANNIRSYQLFGNDGSPIELRAHVFPKVVTLMETRLGTTGVIFPTGELNAGIVFMETDEMPLAIPLGWSLRNNQYKNVFLCSPMMWETNGMAAAIKIAYVLIQAGHLPTQYNRAAPEDLLGLLPNFTGAYGLKAALQAIEEAVKVWIEKRAACEDAYRNAIEELTGAISVGNMPQLSEKVAEYGLKPDGSSKYNLARAILEHEMPPPNRDVIVSSYLEEVGASFAIPLWIEKSII